MPQASNTTAQIESPLRTLRNIGWLLAAQLIAGGGQFLLGILLARHLPLEDFGRWAFAFAFVALFSSFADFGLSTLATRDLARDHERTGQYLGSALVLKCVQAPLLLCAMAFILPAVTRDSTVAALVLLLGAQIVLVSFAQLSFALFRARGRMRLETLVRCSHVVPLLSVSGCLVALGAGVVAFAWAALATAAIGLFCAAVFSFVIVRPIRLSFDGTLARALASDLWPIGLGTALTAVYYYADSVLLGLFGSEADVALYGAAYLPLLGVALVAGALRNAYFPALSRATVSSGGERRRLLRQYGRLSAMLALPVVVAGPIVAGPLLALLYGEEFTAATTALSILFITGGAMFFSSYFGSDLLVSGRQRTYLVGVGAGASLNIALNLILIPALGIEGAAIATVASESIVFAFVWWQTRAQAVPLGDLIAPPAVASVAMGGVLIAALRFAPLYVSALPATAVYGLVLFLLSGSGVRRQIIGVAGSTLVVRREAPADLAEAA